MQAIDLIGKWADSAKAKALATTLIFALLVVGCGSEKGKSDNAYKSLAFFKPNPQNVSVSLVSPSDESLESPIVVSWPTIIGVFMSVDVDRREQVSDTSSLSANNTSSTHDDDWEKWETIAHLDHNAGSYSDSSTGCGRDYEYRVCAVLTDGKRVCSEPVHATTHLCPPRDLTATYTSPGEVELNWTDNSIGELWFYIFRKTAPSGPYEQIGTVGANVTTYLDSNASCETRYLYKVQAANGHHDSGFSNEASVLVGPCPVAPSNLTATAISISQITLIWADNSLDEDGFRIEKALNTNGPFTEIATTAANTITFTDNGLNTFTTYYYRVRSFNNGGMSGYSNVASATTPSVWLVDVNATGAGTGKSWKDAFNVIQDGMNAASAGEMVWVAEGTYTGGSYCLTMKNGVGIYGGFDGTESSLTQRGNPFDHPTILDGQNTSYHVVIAASSSRLDGFTITRGNANGSSPNNKGGGIFNNATTGFTLANCIIEHNKAALNGGGIYNHDAYANSISNCIFRVNYATNGGAVSSDLVDGPSDITQTFTNCIFANNFATRGAATYESHMVGLYENCVFSGNIATTGTSGAGYTIHALATIRNSIIWSDGRTNHDDLGIGGGFSDMGIYDVYNSDYKKTCPIFTLNGHCSNVISFNPLFLNTPDVWDYATVAGTTTTVTVPSGTYYHTNDVIELDDDNVARTVTDVTGNVVTFNPATSSPATIYELVQNWGPGAANLVEDFHLLPISLCINTGTLTGAPTDDLEGNPRPSGAGFDMGAYEYQWP